MGGGGGGGGGEGFGGREGVVSDSSYNMSAMLVKNPPKPPYSL